MSTMGGRRTFPRGVRHCLLSYPLCCSHVQSPCRVLARGQAEQAAGLRLPAQAQAAVFWAGQRRRFGECSGSEQLCRSRSHVFDALGCGSHAVPRCCPEANQKRAWPIKGAYVSLDLLAMDCDSLPRQLSTWGMMLKDYAPGRHANTQFENDPGRGLAVAPGNGHDDDGRADMVGRCSQCGCGSSALGHDLSGSDIFRTFSSSRVTHGHTPARRTFFLVQRSSGHFPC